MKRSPNAGFKFKTSPAAGLLALCYKKEQPVLFNSRMVRPWKIINYIAGMKKCYNCGKELNAGDKTVEHVPAKNLYEGFGEEFKKNRITVPACSACNNLYSKIDQEKRDALAVKNDDPKKKQELTGKGIRSIMRRSNWKDRTHVNINGDVVAVDFSYAELRELHIKNFKALFFRKYGFPVANDYKIEIFADGDEKLISSAQVLHDYIMKDKNWEISGHQDVFKFILKDVTPDRERNRVYESGDFSKLQAVLGLLVYHDDIGAIVAAGKPEYIASCKPKGYTEERK